MELFSKLQILVIAEVLFFLLVAAGVAVMALRQGIRRYTSELAAYEERIQSIQGQCDKLQIRLAAALQARDKAKAVKAQENERLVTNYQHRIANLEKFKNLYFELEARVSGNVDGEHENIGSVAVLQSVIDTQNRLIADLKAQVSMIGVQLGDKAGLADQLGETVDALERNASNLQKKIDHVKRQRALAEMGVEELNHYKMRVDALESAELRLHNELTEYRRRVAELEKRSPVKKTHGVVHVKEIDDLSKQLKERERELKRLRLECETIGLQYEELATQSLALVGDGKELSDDKKQQLEALKNMLEDNSAALARKQAECDMLENYYLELEESAELAKTELQLTQGYAEREGQENDQQKLNDQVSTKPPESISNELSGLQSALAEKEKELEMSRSDYRELKEQFVDVAQEEIELKRNNQTLKQERDKLRRELRDLRDDAQNDESQSEELEKLKKEYSKMEERYLALIDKR